MTRRGEATEDFITMLVGKHNPFSDKYVKREIRWYGLKPYQVDGVSIKILNPQMRIDDYLNKNWRIDDDLMVPTLFIDGQLWMSLTPMEIQSQYLAILNAGGEVGVAGLGMGYSALKIAQKADVDKVTVFEIDPRIVNFFRKTFRRRKGFDKIEFVVGDAREEVPKHQFDFLYVDIYKTMLPDEIVSDIGLFQGSVHEFPDGYHFWGQERVLVDSALALCIIEPDDLGIQMRAYLTRWMQTPVSEDDDRLKGYTLDGMYDPKCGPDFAESVLDALGML